MMLTLLGCPLVVFLVRVLILYFHSLVLIVPTSSFPLVIQVGRFVSLLLSQDIIVILTVILRILARSDRCERRGLRRRHGRLYRGVIPTVGRGRGLVGRGRGCIMHKVFYAVTLLLLLICYGRFDLLVLLGIDPFRVQVRRCRAQDWFHKYVPSPTSQVGDTFADKRLLGHVIVALWPDQIVSSSPILTRRYNRSLLLLSSFMLPFCIIR